MRVLWVVCFVVPQAAELVGGGDYPFGGWVSSMIDQLARVPEVQLGVAMRAPVRAPVQRRIGNVDYFALPHCGLRNHDIEKGACHYALDAFRPDLLHLAGSEGSQAHTFLSCWAGPNVVELQGIINGHDAYQFGCLPIEELLLSPNPVRFAAGWTMLLNKRFRFTPRLKREAAANRMAQNFLGRTLWDKAHAYAVNPTVPYFRCNRVLRDPFYRREWRLQECERTSLFVGNSATALKGAHFAVRAVAQLRREYRHVRLYVAGSSPFPSSWRDLKKHLGYAAYLRQLIRRLEVGQHVVFTGPLQAEEMAERMARSHVFVLSSTIENSPNTLAEAMLVGVPAVAAFAGGAPDMARDGEEALFYRANDPHMLAYQVKRVFDDDDLALSLSTAARRRALVTHNPAANLESLLHAYRTILGETSS